MDIGLDWQSNDEDSIPAQDLTGSSSLATILHPLSLGRGQLKNIINSFSNAAISLLILDSSVCNQLYRPIYSMSYRI